ncbi:MAG TPA: YihY/virulence factor BrkB family protein [bacterium]|nr:YihY/virulence factor BrkB family protein [bacterium]
MAQTRRALASLPARWRARLWGKPGMGPGPWWLRVLRALWLTVESFERNHLTIHASGLTFYLLLTVVPFLAFVLLVLRVFQVAERLRPYILSFVAGGNMDLVPRIDEYIRNAQSGMVGGLGVAVTFTVGFVLLQRVKTTLNIVWEVDRPQGYRSRFIEYVAVLTVTPVLLAVAFSVTGFLGSQMVMEYVPAWVLRVLPSIPVANLSGYAIIVLVTFYAYRFLPDARVDAAPALLGALVAATGLVLVQKFYVVLIVLMSRESPIYGALALLPFLMLWFYLAWIVFLAGAQLGFVVQHFERELELKRAGESALAHRPYLALLVLATLLRELAATGKGVRRQELARTLHLPNDTVHDILGVLTGAGLITPVQGDAARYVPQEVLDRLTALDVLQRTELLPGFPDVPLWHGHPAGHPLLGLFRDANRALATSLTTLTLRDLAQRLEPEQHGPAGASGSAGPSDQAAG